MQDRFTIGAIQTLGKGRASVRIGLEDPEGPRQNSPGCEIGATLERHLDRKKPRTGFDRSAQGSALGMPCLEMMYPERVLQELFNPCRADFLSASLFPGRCPGWSV